MANGASPTPPATIQPRSGGSATENGRPSGPWTTWYDSDKKASEGGYEDGVKAGDWTFWKEDGELDEERTGPYEDDKLTKSRRRRMP